MSERPGTLGSGPLAFSVPVRTDGPSAGITTGRPASTMPPPVTVVTYLFFNSTRFDPPSTEGHLIYKIVLSSQRLPRDFDIPSHGIHVAPQVTIGGHRDAISRSCVSHETVDGHDRSATAKSNIPSFRIPPP
jgi:hypothetical protein